MLVIDKSYEVSAKILLRLQELHSKWSVRLGLDGKVCQISDEEYVFLSAVDLGTQDIVDYELSRSEDYIRVSSLSFKSKGKGGLQRPGRGCDRPRSSVERGC
jgi:hypothetical protein